MAGGDVAGGDVAGGDVAGGDVAGGDVAGGDVAGGDGGGELAVAIAEGITARKMTATHIFRQRTPEPTRSMEDPSQWSQHCLLHLFINFTSSNEQLSNYNEPRATWTNRNHMSSQRLLFRTILGLG